METIRIINYIITVIFAVCYSYQFIYVPVSLWWQHREKNIKNGSQDPSADTDGRELKKYAVLICARNEEAVIGDLIDSINRQTYSGRVTTFVMADNCTDRTYFTAIDHGAAAYTRRSKDLIGKGYALEALLKEIRRDFPEGFDGYFVFDADNILAPDYIEEMHKCHMEGNDIITSCRNTKNYGDNWISSGYGLWFLRESMYLNYSRHKLGSSAAISGTGFFFSGAVLKDIGTWRFHLLTEDIGVADLDEKAVVNHCDLTQKIFLEVADTLGVSNHYHDHASLDVVHDVAEDPVKVRLVGLCKAFSVTFEKELEIEETRLERGSLHLIVVVVKSAYIIAVIGNHVSQSAAGHKSNFALILTCLGVAEHPVVGIHYQHDVVLLLGYIRSDKYFLGS